MKQSWSCGNGDSCREDSKHWVHIPGSQHSLSQRQQHQQKHSQVLWLTTLQHLLLKIQIPETREPFSLSLYLGFAGLSDHLQEVPCLPLSSKCLLKGRPGTTRQAGPDLMSLFPPSFLLCACMCGIHKHMYVHVRGGHVCMCLCV